MVALSRLRLVFLFAAVVALLEFAHVSLRLVPVARQMKSDNAWRHNDTRDAGQQKRQGEEEAEKDEQEGDGVVAVVTPRYTEPGAERLGGARDVAEHGRLCEEAGFLPAVRPANDSTGLRLCECVPPTLAGRFNGSFEVLSWARMARENREVEPGGVWRPRDCRAHGSLVVIIPVMNRTAHLQALLGVLHPFLQRQQLAYRVYVAEQKEPPIFNKGSLLNAAFTEATRLFPADCVIFHDVDMLPEDDRNMYYCGYTSPLHAGVYVDKYNYTFSGGITVGGVIGFTPDHFTKVNGYSNHYYGWGGEDDDMLQRIKHEKLLVRRHSRAVARYTMIEHGRDNNNPINNRRHHYLGQTITKGRAVYRKDGLNTVRYEIFSLTREPLYTRIQVLLPPEPEYFSEDAKAKS